MLVCRFPWALLVGQSTDTISDVVVINKQYLLAGGHQVVSDSGSDSLAIDNTLYLIDRNNWTVSSRSFDQAAI